MLEYLDGRQFKEMIIAGANKLEANKELVNSLNVFPVPDGDTGTNMWLTLSVALDQLKKIKSDSLKQAADALSNGTFMGARGNSGVILAQLFRGLAKGTGQRDKLNAIGLARALDRAVKTLYQAGGFRPVEGTIVTVIREAAKAAWVTARKTQDILIVWDAVVETAEKTLAKTPKMLKALEEAGVIDAGGQGLVFILQGAGEYLRGNTGQLTIKKEGEQANLSVERIASCAIEHQYCTEFILQGKGISLKELENNLQSKGDSVLVVGDAKTVKVHLHTNHPGVVLEYALQWGTLHKVQISNMVEQQQEKTKENLAGKEKEIGIVAVVNGAGLAQLFTSLGCDQIVEGGQTMNPSTEELVEAVGKVKAKKILLLPNNKNILLTAQQVATFASEQEIKILPSLSVPQGMAALLALEPDLTWNELEKKMENSMAQVKTAEITYAVKDCIQQGKEIKRGAILGIWEGEIALVGDTPCQVVQDLLQEKLAPETEIITIFYGKDLAAEKAGALAIQLTELYPQLEVELRYGGQPYYYYLLSIE